MEEIHDIWVAEDSFIDDFAMARAALSESEFRALEDKPRSIHFVLKPTEDGTAELDQLPHPIELKTNVDLVPGRLTPHLFEAKIGERVTGIYQGDPLSIRTATRVRSIAYEYADAYDYDIILFDTSPSLGALNRNLLSLADGFLIPCAPDLFSVYGIRNIGSALSVWEKQFDTIFSLLSDAKRKNFPEQFVRFIGYTLYNAKRYAGGKNDLDLAQAHYNYAIQIPQTIEKFIAKENILDYDNVLKISIGDNAVIHTHNTFPSMSQKYHQPMWCLPSYDSLEAEDRSTIAGNQSRFLETQGAYRKFAEDFIRRIEALNV